MREQVCDQTDDKAGRRAGEEEEEEEELLLVKSGSLEQLREGGLGGRKVGRTPPALQLHLRVVKLSSGARTGGTCKFADS